MNKARWGHAGLAVVVATMTARPALGASPDTPAPGVFSAQDRLPRQAALGFVARVEGPKLIVEGVESGSRAEAAGLRSGSRLTRINGEPVLNPEAGRLTLTRLRAEQPVHLTVDNDDETASVRFRPGPKALESMPGASSRYGSVRVDAKTRLRAILSAPRDRSGPLPLLLFTQWVSCGSIEYVQGSEAREILASLAARSGLALVRVERSGTGDSEGVPCRALDYDTEVAHYIEAFTQILKSPRVDPSVVFIYGSSLGSTSAPLVAEALASRGFRIGGIVVQGGGAETYYERMLTFDRQYLERRPEGWDPARIHDEILQRVRFHYEYLVKARHPDAVAQDSAEMAKIRQDIRGLGAVDHYGRPFAWHQQAAARNFLGAWVKLNAPALVVFNDFEQFEARYGHRSIVDVLNRMRPGSARLVVQPRVGHSNRTYTSIHDAYAGADGRPAWKETAELILDWLREIRSPAS